MTSPKYDPTWFYPGYTQEELDILHKQQQKQAGQMLKIQAYLAKCWLTKRQHDNIHKQYLTDKAYLDSWRSLKFNCSRCRRIAIRNILKTYRKFIW